MMNRRLLYVFIFTSSTTALVVNYFFPVESLWMLLLLPSIATIVVFPTRKVAITVGISGIIMMVITEFASQQEHFTYQDAFQLTVTGAVELVVFTIVSYFYIKSARLIMELGQMALTDPLTKIHNRRYLDLYMEKTVSAFQCKELPMTLILLDIDQFKSINDTHGHSAGDMVLKKVTLVIKGMTRDSDVFVRMGGEEFILILPNCPLEQGMKFAEQIRKEIESLEFVYKGERINVTVSMGITECSKGQDLSQFIEKADQALYRAKETGRNRVVVI